MPWPPPYAPTVTTPAVGFLADEPPFPPELLDDPDTFIYILRWWLRKIRQQRQATGLPTTIPLWKDFNRELQRQLERYPRDLPVQVLAAVATLVAASWRHPEILETFERHLRSQARRRGETITRALRVELLVEFVQPVLDGGSTDHPPRTGARLGFQVAKLIDDYADCTTNVDEAIAAFEADYPDEERIQLHIIAHLRSETRPGGRICMKPGRCVLELIAQA
jgi:hypothetical protein